MNNQGKKCKECGRLLSESKFGGFACRNWAYCKSAEKEKGICLSYLMGADDIVDDELTNVGILIKGKAEGGDRKLEFLKNDLPSYVELIKQKLNKGFWNEIISDDKFFFIFKFEDGSIIEFELNTENEKEINRLCAKFNNEPPDKTANVYKYLSENNFYRDFMIKHYSAMINRQSISSNLQ